MDKKDFENAIKEFSQAVSLNPGSADSYLCRAICQKTLGDNQHSLDLYRKSIQDYKQAASIYHSAGNKVQSKKLATDAQTLQDFVTSQEGQAR